MQVTIYSVHKAMNLSIYRCTYVYRDVFIYICIYSITFVFLRTPLSVYNLHYGHPVAYGHVMQFTSTFSDQNLLTATRARMHMNYNF